MDGPAPTLDQLAARMRDGDARAFEAWVRELHPMIFRLCRRLVAHPADTEDAVQDTFIRAWRSAATLREPAAHRGWVCQIARRTCADRARAAGTKVRPTVELTSATAGSLGLTSPAAPLDEAVHAAELGAVVTAAIADLKDQHRVVLLLREVDDLSYEEIADALGVPRGTVESRLHRARAELGRALARHRLMDERTSR